MVYRFSFVALFHRWLVVEGFGEALQVWLCCVVSSLANGGKVRGGLAVTSSAGGLQVWLCCVASSLANGGEVRGVLTCSIIAWPRPCHFNCSGLARPRPLGNPLATNRSTGTRCARSTQFLFVLASVSQLDLGHDRPRPDPHHCLLFYGISISLT